MTEWTGRSLPRHWGGSARGLAAGAAMLTTAGCITDWPGTEPLGTGSVETATAAPVSPAPALGSPAVAPVSGPVSEAPTLQPQPALFHANAWALWDGGRTTGGIWVALPQVGMARRVRITNEDTGAQIDGAMLRRRPGSGGPEMEISSEAASALGLAPGSPTPVTIVALAYPEPAGSAGELAASPESAAADAPAAETGQAGSGGDAAAATASADNAGTAEPSEASTAAPSIAPGTATAEAGAAAPPAPATVSAASVEPPAETGPAPAALAASVSPETATAGAAQAEAPIADGKPFIQAGIFADAKNAGQLIGKLEAAGLTAVGLPLVRGTASLTRVVVGPFGSIAERDRALATVRRIGPADAMPVEG